MKRDMVRPNKWLRTKKLEMSHSLKLNRNIYFVLVNTALDQNEFNDPLKHQKFFLKTVKLVYHLNDTKTVPLLSHLIVW